ncbi:MAG TPA: cysteine--tRNA ligase [Candidatus Saccharimonadia bacterium]|nr:cysteine--tRNA ligase [Candidatus Saccharimonadia bacterium]
MRLYNSLNRQLETVTANADKTVTLYTCGPTVYDHVHIGNLRTFIMEDLLRRTLQATGYKVQMVTNLTDVDDKTIARSQTEHPDLGPMEALIETTRHYEAVFKADLAALGVDLGSRTFVRATDAIPQMQALIQRIYDNGFAYVADGSVYFDLRQYREAGNEYGRLVNVDYSAQARIDNDEYDKAEAQDFALWKGAKDGEPFWEFTLGEHDLPGRPGWHIECSAMALDNLGEQPIGIHSGGIDLKFPHHENEIAQVVAATGQDFARIFTHHNHLLVDGRKMSKSLNNFYTLDDIRAKGYDPLALRLLYLQALHTNEVNFTWESLGAAQNTLANLRAWADLVYQPEVAGESATPKLEAELQASLADDLHSPEALARLAAETGAPTTELLVQLDQLLGLDLSGRPDLTPAEQQLVANRQAARTAKDWARADQLRTELAAAGLEVDDAPAGPRWRRTTS